MLLAHSLSRAVDVAAIRKATLSYDKISFKELAHWLGRDDDDGLKDTVMMAAMV